MKSAHGQIAFDRVDRYKEDGQMRCRKGKPCNGRCIPRSHECANANQAASPVLSRSQKIKGLADTVSSVAGAVGGVVAAGSGVVAAGLKVNAYRKANQAAAQPKPPVAPSTSRPIQGGGQSETRKYKPS